MVGLLSYANDRIIIPLRRSPPEQWKYKSEQDSPMCKGFLPGTPLNIGKPTHNRVGNRIQTRIAPMPFLLPWISPRIKLYTGLIRLFTADSQPDLCIPRTICYFFLYWYLLRTVSLAASTEVSSIDIIHR